MKKLLQLFVTGIFVISLSFGAVSQVADSIEMGDSYANDVYYSLTNGEVKVEARATWDIAIYTSVMSAGIITNGGSGVDLWVYPNGDTSAWNSIDTNGMYMWPVLHNSEQNWEDGAFNQNSGNHPDYGWGVYNPISHDVVGDSLFVIKLLSGEYKKIWIVQKYSSLNKYMIRFANLDGSDEMEKEFEIMPYVGKNFVYYSFANDLLIDREPAKDAWDIVWTKYVAEQPTGGTYPVTGILSNVNMAGNKFYPVSLDFDDWSAKTVDTTISSIGFDWKELDFITFEYDVVDSTVFFVTDVAGNINKMVFKSFQIGTGKTVFSKQVVSLSSNEEYSSLEIDFVIYPNPVKETLNFKTSFSASKLNAFVYDITGKLMLSREFNDFNKTAMLMHVDQLKEGLYFLVIESEGQVQTQKFVKRN
jgi:extradiol dioxygenase family protein